MSDLDEQFDDAVRRVAEMTTDPGNQTKLRLYALYKQATAGDVSGKRPGLTNPVGRAKYDAWAGVSGMSTPEAKRAYVGEVDALPG